MSRPTRLERRNLIKLVYLAIGSAIAFWANDVCAQSNIEADETFGSESSQVIRNADGLPLELIGGGAKRGANLFHSFREFNVSEGRAAYFINPSGVENILSRVTGTNPSSILGGLGVRGNANLFLMNPNGIIFGQNAVLDVKGSFVATTASSINFADGTQFSATAPQTAPLLTVNVPVGLQFGTNPGSISVQGQPNRILSQTLNEIGEVLAESFTRNQSFDTEEFVREGTIRITQLVNSLTRNFGLQVRPGKTLALVGGDVTLNGATLTTLGGRIELGSVADRGTVSLTPTTNGLKLSYEGVSRFGNINLSGQALLNSSGLGSSDVQIRGDRVTFQNGSAIFAATLGNRQAGNISIEAQQLNFSRNSNIIAIAFVLERLAFLGGRSANISLKTDKLTVEDSLIGSFSIGRGDTGNIGIQATDSVQLIRTPVNALFPIGILSVTTGAKKGGDITIQTRQLTATDGAQVSAATAGVGQGGTVFVNASDVTASGESANGKFPSGIFASSFGIGAAGNLNINTQRLTVLDGANVSTFTRGGPGGTVNVKASDFVRVIGSAPISNVPSDISADTLGEKRAGDVRIETGQLAVRDRGRISAVTFLPLGTGAAGNIEIEAQSIELDNQGTISTDTRSGEFGNIKLRSPIVLLRRGSQIATNALETASGGDIDIDTQFLIAVPNENSDITANAIAGQGGNINITAQGIFGTQFRRRPTPLSDITASSEFGTQGVVAIDVPDLNPNRTLVNLPTQTITTEVVQACTPSPNRAQNEFVITGRGGLPPTPSEVLSNEAIEVDWVTLDSPRADEGDNRSGLLNSREVDGETMDFQTDERESQSNLLNPAVNRIIEAQGWVVGSDGTIVLTAQTPTVTPHIPWLPSNTCQGS
ncbi:MAG: S-layer family protein [Hydrococcus sp. Prado102]|nr:S-layer family protein [Hydrococcus sp. Prado102]